MFQKTGQIPRIPKGLVKPTIVAGINSLGRGQDVQALGQFLTTIAQTMGPESIQQYINPEELIKRLAAAQGIDVLNLVKSVQDRQQEQQQAQVQQAEMEAVKGAPAMMNSPMADPSKNPALAAQMAPEGEGPPLPPQV